MHTSAVFPVLHASGLSLVGLSEAYIPALFRLLTDTRVTSTYHVRPFTAEEDIIPVLDMFRQKFLEGSMIRWGIAIEDGNELVGVISLINISADSADIIYAVHPDYWGKGYAAQAIGMVADYAFSVMDIKEINADVLPGNMASQKVLLKNGFSHRAFLQDGFTWNGQAFDVDRFCLSCQSAE